MTPHRQIAVGAGLGVVASFAAAAAVGWAVAYRIFGPRHHPVASTPKEQPWRS